MARVQGALLDTRSLTTSPLRAHSPIAHAVWPPVAGWGGQEPHHTLDRGGVASPDPESHPAPRVLAFPWVQGSRGLSLLISQL